MSGTIPHIAVVLHVETDADARAVGFGDRDTLEREVVFWTEALRIQLARHWAAAYRDFSRPPAAFYYGTSTTIPDDAAAILGVFRDAMNEDAAGYHYALGRRVIGAVDLSRSRRPSVTLSHEGCEMARNPFLSAWAQHTDTRRIAMETSDPVQAQSYRIPVEVLGQQRMVEVGNFVTPAWWDHDERGPYDYLGDLSEPFEIAEGGYAIAEEGGQIVFLPSRSGGFANLNDKLSHPMSRTAQLAKRLELAPDVVPPAPF